MSEQRGRARDAARAAGRGAGGRRTATARRVPQVPPPPVAAVHRPSTWTPGRGRRVIEAPAAAPAPPSERSTWLASDADLDRFVRSLLARPPADREAIRAGRLRFTLGGGARRERRSSASSAAR